MRDSLFFFLNGSPVRVQDRAVFEMLAPFLRREHNLTGTKVACAQGACGACTVLVGRPQGDSFAYLPINSCIYPVSNCDGCHVVTIEGLNGQNGLHRGADNETLSAVQNALVQCHGAQCGFCTPGIVVALTAFHEREARDLPVDAQRVKTALEGNLCRCTGYSAIVDAGLGVETSAFRPLAELYSEPPLLAELATQTGDAVSLQAPANSLQSEQILFVPRSFEAALAWKAEHPGALVVAGATEVGVAMSETGFEPREVLSLAHVEGLDEVRVETDAAGHQHLSLGARATWTQVEPVAQEQVPEFGLLLRRWGSPQLRNAGTVAGNLVRGVSISDSLPFLLVCDAQIELASTRGTRRVDVETFLGKLVLGDGSRLRDLHPDELVSRVLITLPGESERLRLDKVTKRRSYDRSIVSAAFLVKVSEGVVERVRIAYGGIDSVAIRLPQTEEFLRGQQVAGLDWKAASQVAQSEIEPPSNASAGADYRRQLVTNLLRKWVRELRAA